MDNFQVVLLSQALKFYKTCPEELAARLNKCFKGLEKTPFFGPNIKLLKVQKKNKLYRYRIGDYRVIYDIDKIAKKVGIFLISTRSEAYRKF